MSGQKYSPDMLKYSKVICSGADEAYECCGHCQHGRPHIPRSSLGAFCYDHIVKCTHTGEPVVCVWVLK